MTKTTLALIAIAGLSLPATALADDCRHSRDVDLALDLAGASRIAIEVGRHDLDVRGGTASALRITGRACASSEAELDAMKVEQSRRGDTLVVRLDARSGSGWSLFGNRQASFHLAAALPSDIPVSLEVGSGDANVTGVHSLDADVGSGDLDASRIAGEVVVGVGSGDIELEDVGALRVTDIGSGDVAASGVRGGVSVGGIGSGDLELQGVAGDVEIASIGSGDAGLRDVAGHVRVGTVGSGDVRASDIGGDLVVRRVGSGDVGHRGVRGRVDVPAD